MYKDLPNADLEDQLKNLLCVSFTLSAKGFLTGSLVPQTISDVKSALCKSAFFSTSVK